MHNYLTYIQFIPIIIIIVIIITCTLIDVAIPADRNVVKRKRKRS